MASFAESPSDVSMIAAIWESRRSKSMIRCLAGASSSATSTQRPSDTGNGMRLLVSPSQRQRYFNFGSTAGAPVDGETGFSVGIKPRHALPGHRKADTGGVFERPTGGKSDAVVEHTDVKAIPVPPHRDDHRSARCPS